MYTTDEIEDLDMLAGDVSAFEVGAAVDMAGPVRTARAMVGQAENWAEKTATPAQLRALATQQEEFWMAVCTELRRMADVRET